MRERSKKPAYKAETMKEWRRTAKNILLRELQQVSNQLAVVNEITGVQVSNLKDSRAALL